MGLLFPVMLPTGKKSPTEQKKEEKEKKKKKKRKKEKKKKKRKGEKKVAERGFDPPTFGLWAQRAPAAPLCWQPTQLILFKYRAKSKDFVTKCKKLFWFDFWDLFEVVKLKRAQSLPQE